MTSFDQWVICGLMWEPKTYCFGTTKWETSAFSHPLWLYYQLHHYAWICHAWRPNHSQPNICVITNLKVAKHKTEACMLKKTAHNGATVHRQNIILFADKISPKISSPTPVPCTLLLTWPNDHLVPQILPGNATTPLPFLFLPTIRSKITTPTHFIISIKHLANLATREVVRGWEWEKRRVVVGILPNRPKKGM